MHEDMLKLTPMLTLALTHMAHAPLATHNHNLGTRVGLEKAYFWIKSQAEIDASKGIDITAYGHSKVKPDTYTYTTNNLFNQPLPGVF